MCFFLGYNHHFRKRNLHLAHCWWVSGSLRGIKDHLHKYSLHLWDQINQSKKTTELQESTKDESISHHGKIDTSLTSKKATDDSYVGNLHHNQVRHEADQGISSYHLENDQNPHYQQPTSKKATKATKSASKLTICCAEETRQLLQLLLRDVLSLNRFEKVIIFSWGFLFLNKRMIRPAVDPVPQKASTVQLLVECPGFAEESPYLRPAIVCFLT